MEHVPDIPDGLECMNCPEGTYEEGEVTKAFERDESVVVVRGIPAYVCEVCGDALLGRAEMERLHTILDRADKLEAESLVCQFGEEKTPTGER